MSRRWLRAFATLLAALIPCSALAAHAIPFDGYRTAGEDAARLQMLEATHTNIVKRLNAQTQDLIIGEIKRSQLGEPHYRRPVSWASIDKLRIHLEKSRNIKLSRADTAALVDYYHAQLRESRTSDPEVFRGKLLRSLSVKRPAFHGQLAELAEARERGMVLTKDTRSQTFDLTEARRRPRSLQLKVFADSRAGLRELQADLSSRPARARHGSLPRKGIQTLEARGLLRRRVIGGGDPVYVPRSGERITVSPMRSFESAEASQNYLRSAVRSASLIAGPSRTGLRAIASHGLPVIGGIGVPLLAASAYEHAVTGWQMLSSPVLPRSASPYLHLGLAGVQGLESLALTFSVANSLSLAPAGLQSWSALAARGFLPLAVAAESLSFGVAYHEFRTGHISERELMRRAAPSVSFLAFAGTGAAIGSFVPGVGTTAGAAAGAMVAIPVSLFAVYGVDWVSDRKFEDDLRVARFDALRAKYGRPS